MADRVGETQAENGFDDRLMAQADAEREPVGVRLLNGECLLGEHGRTRNLDGELDVEHVAKRTRTASLRPFSVELPGIELSA